MLLNCGVGNNSWDSLGLQGDPTSSSWRKSVLNIHWKDWFWSWNSSTLATWCKELTHLKRPRWWEGLKAGGEGKNRGWDGWMASPTQWTWVWVNFRSWWWTGKPGMLQFMGLQRVGHDWVTELNWIINGWLNFVKGFFCICWNDHMVFIFQLVNMVYHLDWFACMEESLHLWTKPNLIMVYELFDVLLKSVC